MTRHLLSVRWPLILLLLAGLSCRPLTADTDFTRYVNPFIGTRGTGHAFPGPSMPFGLVQPGPDNRDKGWDYTSGYQYDDSLLLGFSQTRINGAGISELGDVRLLPLAESDTGIGPVPYLKSSEKASPGYYTVTLQSGIRAELTCTERVALHRYHFPGSRKRVLVDLQHGLRFLTDSLVLESRVTIDNNRRISGYVHTRNWVERRYFFVLETSEAFRTPTLLPGTPQEKAPRYLLEFENGSAPLLVKIALSAVSVDGARNNLGQELPGWDFSAIAERARRSWQSYLGRVEIDGHEEQKTVFYSALYRLLLQPSNLADADGNYRGADDSVRQAPGGVYYSTFSLWDTYRAAHPLYTLLVPERVPGFINSMLEHARAAGFLPIWTVWGKDNYCMIGNHAIPVIADAIIKGFSGFDQHEALRLMVKSSTEPHINSQWNLLDRFGYYPFDSLDNESVSRLLEHGVDDAALARTARILGDSSLAGMFTRRSQRYRNVYDSSTHLFRGKDSRGNWRTPFDPLTPTSPMNNPGDYTEANAWQYFWTPAQHDPAGLVNLLGGTAAFTEKLDSFFSLPSRGDNKHLGQEALIGQYAHGNEPSHHVVYLYAWSTLPAKAGPLIRTICRKFYNATPAGLTGNDDCGQMSAWYIFSTLGFYPVDPSAGSFVTGVPLVRKAMIRVPGRPVLTIRAPEGLDWPRQIRLDGLRQDPRALNFHNLIQSRELRFE